jgi:co-chaperonin GroES (HSP10)
MENTLVNIKQEWLNEIENYIFARGFQSTDYGYERVQITRQPGQTISINGRVMQQPGKEIKITQNVIVVGDGWIANTNESNKMDFTQVRFETYQEDNLVMEYEETYYWDEPNVFLSNFIKAFN